MDGMALPMGGSTTIKWKGKTYELPPLQIKDWATIENEVLRRKREAKMEAVAALHGKIPDAAWNVLLREAVSECEKLREVPAEEIQEFVESRAGVAFTLWIELNKKYQGEFDLDDMLEVMAMQSEDAVAILTQARDQANGLDVAGKVGGSAQE